MLPTAITNKMEVINKLTFNVKLSQMMIQYHRHVRTHLVTCSLAIQHGVKFSGKSLKLPISSTYHQLSTLIHVTGYCDEWQYCFKSTLYPEVQKSDDY